MITRWGRYGGACALMAWLLGAALGGCSCSDDEIERAGTGGQGAGSGTGGVDPHPGICGDGSCVLQEGENAQLCPEDCGAPAAPSAQVRFFADFNSKAVEYDQQVRFTYVVWNEGDTTASNVVLPVPIVQDASTPTYGSREHCGKPEAGYDCMVDLSYVPGSMRLNRVYHPNRARNSYYFVDTVPLTDGLDGDEGYFDAPSNTLYLTLPQLRPRGAEPETAGVVWSYELATDGGVANTPCEDFPLVQNWNYVFADNAEEYNNDIIGHIFCTSPWHRATLEADSLDVAAGGAVTLTATMSYDDLEPPPGKEKSRFELLRPRLYLSYPERLLQIESVDKPEEASDLPGHDGDTEGGGVVYWAREDDGGDTLMQPGESESMVVVAHIDADVPLGTVVDLVAMVRSQRTLPHQILDAELRLTVTSGPDPSCGDGFCTAASEDAASCGQDCPACTAEDGVASFGDLPCCDGLTLIRGSHPYSWAYEQCYDWEGGGLPDVQGYCTACGDGQCGGKENGCNCPEDCGPHCGNWQCEAGEDRASCPADC